MRLSHRFDRTSRNFGRDADPNIGGGGPSVSYLLDDYPAFAAYSVRQLKGSATLCMRVQRTGDNAQADIGFVDGWLDETALSAHVGANTGLVIAFYDQSGNGIDLINMVAPKIVDAGVVNKVNGKPAIFSQSVSDGSGFRAASIPSAISAPYTMFSVNKPSSTTTEYIFENTTGDAEWWFNSASLAAWFGGSVLGSSSKTGQNSQTILINGAGSVVRWNGAQVIAGNLGTNGIGTNGFRIMNSLGGSDSIETMQEFLIYNDDQTANFTPIETDVITAFSIP